MKLTNNTLTKTTVTNQIQSHCDACLCKIQSNITITSNGFTATLCRDCADNISHAIIGLLFTPSHIHIDLDITKTQEYISDSLDECNLCHDTFPISQLTLTNSQYLCQKCIKPDSYKSC